MEELISNSYNVSKDNSCKLLLMTATPFTNSPLELFSLTNLFMTQESEKISTNREEFKQQYMNENNILSEKGVKSIANKLSGYISYLNREKDPTQFAQPIMINIPILMKSIEPESIREALYLNSKYDIVLKEVEELINALKLKVQKMKEDYKLQKQTYNQSKASLSKEEAKSFNNRLKETLINIRELQHQLHDYKTTQSEEKVRIKEIKEKIKIVKNSLIQEYILYTNCKHLQYKNNNSKTKKTQKMVAING